MGYEVFEIDLVAVFFHLLESFPIREDEDWVQWRLKKNGEVDIRSYYNALRGSTSVTFSKVFGCEGPLESFFFSLVGTWQ